ncbi:MAG: hypothetical protein AAGK78_11185, partial [Planctomycetota bacterium]
MTNMLYRGTRAALVAAGLMLSGAIAISGCVSAGKPAPEPRVHGLDIRDLNQGVYRVSTHTVDGRVYEIREIDLPTFFEEQNHYNVVRDGKLLFNTSLERPPFSEVVDGDTGEQLFPVTRGEIVYIPGEGFLHNPRTVDRRQPYLTRVPAREYRLSNSFEPMDWRRVNFETKTLDLTNIAEIRGYEAVEPAKAIPIELKPDTVITAQPDGPTYSRMAIARRIPKNDSEYHEGHFHLTLRDKAGNATAVIPKAVTLPIPAGPFPSLGYIDEAGDNRVAILDHEYQPQSVAPPGTRYFDVSRGDEKVDVKVVLATPAPESTEEWPLYLVFDDRGEFSTPDNVAGFWPVLDRRDRRSFRAPFESTPVAFWLVRYADTERKPGDAGDYKWGLADASLT